MPADSRERKWSYRPKKNPESNHMHCPEAAGGSDYVCQMSCGECQNAASIGDYIRTKSRPRGNLKPLLKGSMIDILESFSGIARLFQFL